MIISILCGGSGTRLWPLSRELMPKQFVKLFNNTSLFQQTIHRNIALKSDFYIITNQEHYFLAQDEILDLDEKINCKYILESIPKNTAAALLFNALSVKSDEIILALPSDHIIKNEDIYIKTIKEAEALAKENFIVLFGIKPTSPNTGYGYILDDKSPIFIEKPDEKKANEYLKSGKYYWNSGIFCFKAGVLIEEFKLHNKKLLDSIQSAFVNATKDSNIIRLRKQDMQNIEDISIDYAIMEKSKRLKLLKSNFAWNDAGSFDALKEEYPKDSNNNISKNQLIALDSSNNFIFSNKLTAAIGINDLIVVDTIDSLLIAKSGESQKVKQVVQKLKQDNSPLCKVHTTTYRPWGSYNVLLENDGYKIKQIIVKPKNRLSLQKHFHRNEHWIVVSGSAMVSIDGRDFFLKPNESTYIPMGSTHRLTNPGRINLVMIEVQVGQYLGEDDIVRLEDDFNRGN